MRMWRLNIVSNAYWTLSEASRNISRRPYPEPRPIAMTMMFARELFNIVTCWRATMLLDFICSLDVLRKRDTNARLVSWVAKT